MRSLIATVSGIMFFMLPCLANDTCNLATTQAANPLGVVNSTDPALKQAIDFLLESQKATEAKKRRSNVHPGVQDKVVDSKSTTTKRRVLITGGSEAFPM